MAGIYTFGIKPPLSYTGKVSFDSELAVPQYDSVSAMTAAAPGRAGCIGQIGTDLYVWDGTQPVKLSSATATSSTFTADTLNDL